MLVLYDALSIRGSGLDRRGSVSAYYYYYYFSDARDVFVGCLFCCAGLCGHITPKSSVTPEPGSTSVLQA